MHCYFLAVCQGSALDRYTNNFSLFSLLEEVTPSAFPAQLGAHTVAFFHVDERDRDVEHEVRLAVSRPGGDAYNSAPLAFTPKGARHRVRMNGLALPEPALYEIRVDWRTLGADAWNRGTAVWPLRVNGPMQ